MLPKFNSFDKNLTFIVDASENEKVHFLDFFFIKFPNPEIEVFRKSTPTGQFTYFHSFIPWSRNS